MAQFDDLYDRIMPMCPGADFPLVNQHIRYVVREFLKRSTYWREALPLILTKGTQQVRVVPAQDGDVAGILSVMLNERMYPLAKLSESCQRWGYLATQTAPREPCGYWHNTPSLIQFPDPIDIDRMAVVVIYKTISQDPTREFIPDDLMEEWSDSLAAGTIARMLALPGRTWSNSSMAQVYAQQYTRDSYQARALLRGGGQHGTTRVHMARWAR